MVASTPPDCDYTMPPGLFTTGQIGCIFGFSLRCEGSVESSPRRKPSTEMRLTQKWPRQVPQPDGACCVTANRLPCGHFDKPL